MQNLHLEILGKPHTKQSVRSKIIHKAGKSRVMHYKDSKVKAEEKSIKVQISSQLPFGFEPMSNPISLDVTFIFELPKSTKKELKEAVEKGGNIYFRDKKPDLVDNLMKGLCDAMNNVVYDDDSRIVEVSSRKIYGKEYKTLINIRSMSKEYKLF